MHGMLSTHLYSEKPAASSAAATTENLPEQPASWFGGILLGTGGLVKAYSNAAKAALDQARTEPLIKKLSFTLECRYEDYQPLLHAAASLPIQFGTAEFLQTVCVNGSIPLEHRTAFERLVTEITKGASAVQFMDTVPPE